MTMRDPSPEHDDNPMRHPPEQPSGADGTPKFGRLLLVLLVAVGLIVALTFGMESLYRP